MGARTGFSVLLVGVLMAGASPVKGQSPVTLGPRVGFTASAMQFDDHATAGQTETLVGFQAGVAVRRRLGRFASAEVDLLFSREGFRAAGAHTGDLQMDYAAVPVLLHIRTPTRLSLHLTMGGAAKLGLRCRQTAVPLVGTVSCSDPLMGSTWSRLDATGIAGGGVSVPWGQRILAADALLSIGLRDLNDGLFVPGAARSLSVSVTFALLSPWGSRGSAGGS